jgi:Peptidase M50B-like
VQAPHLPLPGGESVAIGLITAIVVMIPLLWAAVEHFSTMTHEGAHALVAVILGLTVTEIVLNRHSEGKTGIVGDGLRAVLVVLIGYLGPSLFGLGAAKLIALGYPLAVLWLLVLLLVLVLSLLGRSFAVISVPIALVLLYLVLRYMHPSTEVVAAYVVAWLLLLAGLRTAIGHIIRSDSEDASDLRSLTHLPRTLWSLVWLAGTALALIVGGKLLVLG